MLGDEDKEYSLKQLEKALPPILLIIIISKNEKILIHYDEESTMFKKIEPVVLMKKRLACLIEGRIGKIR